AQAMVRAEFPGAVLGVYPAVYYGHTDRVRAVSDALSGRGVGWKPAHPWRWSANTTEAVTVNETIVSPRHLLFDLVGRAHALGVRIMPWTAAARLDRDRGRWLVGMPDGQRLRARIVVLAAGAGGRGRLGGLGPQSGGARG